MNTKNGLAALRALTTTASADAELILTCERHAELKEAFNACGEDSGDDCPAWLAYERSRDAITDARPVTLAGIVAKALAAKDEAVGLDGEEEPSGTMGETWAWDLVNDLCGLKSFDP